MCRTYRQKANGGGEQGFADHVSLPVNWNDFAVHRVNVQAKKWGRKRLPVPAPKSSGEIRIYQKKSLITSTT